MIVELECPKCEHEFDATDYIEGSCPNCDNRYQWYEQDFDDGDSLDSWCGVVWETDNDHVKNAFLISRLWIDREHV